LPENATETFSPLASYYSRVTGKPEIACFEWKPGFVLTDGDGFVVKPFCFLR
jgi:hypothetical protein